MRSQKKRSAIGHTLNIQYNDDLAIWFDELFITEMLISGRDFRWSPSEASPQYLDLLPLFADERSALFGIHQLSMVCSDEKPIGTWFGPNGVAQAIKKMTMFDPGQTLNVHVAMNNVLIISEVLSSSASNGPWRPLLLFVPVRLGINDINPTYFSSLKVSKDAKHIIE